jgi:hypothetical protein
MKQITHTTPMALLLAFALLGGSALFATAADAKAPTRKVLVTANSIRLPEFKLDGVTFDEAVRELQAAGRRHDPKHKGVNYLVPDPAKAKASPKITLDLKSVTLAEATEHLAKNAGLLLVAEDYAFVFLAKTDKP